MSGNRPLRIALLLIAVGALLALLQMGRHYQQGVALASGVPQPPACSAAQGLVQPVAVPGDEARDVDLRLDFAGADAVINALGRDSLSDADVDSLLRIRGVCAMVDNVTRFFPGTGAAEFRKEIRAFVRKKKGGKHDHLFQLNGVWKERATVRSLIAAIRSKEGSIIDETLSQIEQYRPGGAVSSGALADSATQSITAYFVAGGVSDGFAFENDPNAFYANLARANGDVNGVVLNMAHEAYHAMQFAAQKRAGVLTVGIANDSSPAIERLFAVTLSEGTANYAVDPTRSSATGPNVDSSRARYRRHAEPKGIAEDFARFDKVLTDLRDGHVTWEKAYAEGFSGDNDASFYFVGYEMTKAIERYCGRECVGRLFLQQPVEFFRQYITLYRAHPDITGRFSPETESFIADYGAKSGG